MWITDWTSRAACRGADPDALFVQGAAQNRAKLICRGCPVRTECLADALDNRIEFGVWGGMTERERRALLRRRPTSDSWRETANESRQREASTNGTNAADRMAAPMVYASAAQRTRPVPSLRYACAVQLLMRRPRGDSSGRRIPCWPRGHKAHAPAGVCATARSSHAQTRQIVDILRHRTNLDTGTVGWAERKWSCSRCSRAAELHSAGVQPQYGGGQLVLAP